MSDLTLFLIYAAITGMGLLAFGYYETRNPMRDTSSGLCLAAIILWPSTIGFFVLVAAMLVVSLPFFVFHKVGCLLSGRSRYW